MSMLTPDAARYYGRPVYVGTAATAEALEQVAADVRDQGRRLVEKGIVRVVVFEASTIGPPCDICVCEYPVLAIGQANGAVTCQACGGKLEDGDAVT